MPRLRVVALLTALGAASACGTTVPTAARTDATAVDASGGLVASAPGAPGALPGTLAPPGGSTAPTAQRERTAPAIAPSAAPLQVVGGATAVGPGVTPTTIYVGFHLAGNVGAANAALGASGVTRGDEKAEIELLIKDVNSRGGFAGRKLAPVYFEYDANDTRGSDAIGQEACDYLTKDHKVFVVLGWLTLGELTCLERAGVWVLTEQLKALADRTVFAEHPFYLEMGSPELGANFTQWVATFTRRGWFAPWNTVTGTPAVGGTAKVGLLTLDYPSMKRAVPGVLEPALKRAGYAPETIWLTTPSSTADLGALSASIASAVLTFKSRGVDHVVITDAGGTGSLLFMNQAESQGYRPRYGGDSNNAWQALLDTGAMSKDQLNGAVGVGFMPLIDLTPADNPDDGRYSNATRRRCLELFRKAGITTSDTNAKGVALINCSKLWILERILRDTKGVLSRPAAIAAVEALGRSVPSASNLGLEFGPGRHAGMSGYYDWVYDAATGTFRYTGPRRHF